MGVENYNKKQFLDGYLDEIFWISNKEHQRRSWILGIELMGGDYGETINRFFDSDVVIKEYYKEFGITEDQNLLLRLFVEEFDNFVFGDHLSDHYDPSEFIDTPEWTRITDMAKGVLKVFDWKNPRNQ